MIFLAFANGLLGLVLVYRAAPLSLRYNAWTTGLRERYPHINPPPTPVWRARNTKIMKVLFRVFGVFLVLQSLFMLFAIVVSSKPH